MSAISTGTGSSVNTGTIVPKSTSSDFHWEIKQFSTLCKDVGSSIVSPEFSMFVAGDVNLLNIAKWRLKLFPNGYIDEIKDHLAVYLEYLGRNTTSVQVTFSLLNNDDSLVVTKKMSGKTFDTKNYSWGYNKFVTKKFIMDSKNRVVMNDTLKIQCEINSSDRAYVWCKRIYNALAECKKTQEATTSLTCRLQEFDDYEKLLENGNFSDIAIVVGDKQFQAHKAIITSRSTVFEAMFKHDMKEKEENEIVITDIKSEVMKELLRFMYAGKVNEIEKMVSDLLMAAEKYSITGLKKLCVKTMLKNLKIENALEFLKLADMCNTPNLKSHAIEFIASNQKAIADKPEFGLFKDLPSDLQFELVQAIIAKNSNQ